MAAPGQPDEGVETSADEEWLRALLRRATADLDAPGVTPRSAPRLVSMSTPAGESAPALRWNRRALRPAVAALAGAAAASALIFGLGLGPTSRPPGATASRARSSARGTGGSGADRAGAGSAVAKSTTPTGSQVLYRLAASIHDLPAPSERYAVQVERQTEGSVSYLKASVIDSRTGDTWTYQRGDGVPGSLPMAPHFSPTEAQLRARYTTNPTDLGAQLASEATAGTGAGATGASEAGERVVPLAITMLWDPLVEPDLRAALVSVIAEYPGVVVDPRARDSEGREAIELSYTTGSLVYSVYLDPSTGAVLEESQRSTERSAEGRQISGSDLYLSQYWTNASPTVDPLEHLRASTGR